jgi:hypothetical protein
MADLRTAEQETCFAGVLEHENVCTLV